ncbi:taste receptor type 2 member 41-like [Dendropsophus ebraccatus]|uniref:taste receptor type 2 member 41-like n=1 Tax=Dendropsophus ebraccatus TaxID=150705 RepID=UPI003831B545
METGYLLFFLVNVIVSCFGINLNLFISVVSYKTWLSHGLHQPQGLLLFCIGLSSAILEGYQHCFAIVSCMWPAGFSSLNVCTVFLHCVFTFCIFFTTCQISWLCSFYCIKLVSFQNRFIVVLKSRLPSILPWIIAGTVVVSAMVMFLMFAILYISAPIENITNSTYYCRRINETYTDYLLFFTERYNIVTSLPFSLTLVSLSCTVWTLIRHIRRVRGTLSLDRSHLEAHIDAIKTMILLLVLNSSYYISKLLMDGNLSTFTNWVSLKKLREYVTVIPANFFKIFLSVGACKRIGLKILQA